MKSPNEPDAIPGADRIIADCFAELALELAHLIVRLSRVRCGSPEIIGDMLAAEAMRSAAMVHAVPGVRGSVVESAERLLEEANQHAAAMMKAGRS